MKLTPEKEGFLRSRVQSVLSPFRYSHTLSVVSECRSLAVIYPCDADSLAAAAYLHDVTKEMSVSDQLALCKSEGVPVSPDSLISEKTLHAESAPAYIKKYLPDFYTKKIAQMIRSHTTARSGMTVGEKLLFLADFIEPTRRFDDCKAVREYFYSKKNKDARHLDETILYALRLTIKELADENRFIHGKTLKAYNHLILTENTK